MSMQPKVSVIIPCCNVAPYLQECLDTVVSQTLQEIEIICINDGSIDETLQILQKYAENNTKIQVIDQTNIGVSETRNKGINIAKGQFVIFMDPDDFYPSNDILERLFIKAIENKVLICGGEFARFYHETKKIAQDFPKTLSGYLFKSDGLIQYQDYQFDYGFHRFIYDREFLISNSIYFPNYKRFQDPPFFVKAMIFAGSFYAIKKIVYGYRKGHANSTWNKEKVVDLVKGLRDNYQFAMCFRLNKLKEYTEKRVLAHLNIVKKESPSLYRTMFTRLLFTRGFFFFTMSIVLDKVKKTFFLVTYSKDKKYKVITILGIQIKLRRNMKNAK